VKYIFSIGAHSLNDTKSPKNKIGDGLKTQRIGCTICINCHFPNDFDSFHSRQNKNGNIISS